MTSLKPTTPPTKARLPTVRELIEEEKKWREILRARMRRMHEKIIAGPVVAPFDGDAARVVELPNGTGRIDYWKRGAGWIEAPEGSIALHSFMPVSAKDAARLGCRLEDFGRHWTEEPASTTDHAKIVGLIKERSWHLAARRLQPGHA